MMLYIKLIIKLEQKRQIQANSDCQGHNGADMARPVCIKVYTLITFKKLHNYVV